MTDYLISPDLASSSDGPSLLAVALASDALRETVNHRHARGQLLGASRGLVSVEAGDCRWVVPATHAVWIPPHTGHALRSHGPFSGWSLYVTEAVCAEAELPGSPCILAVSGLLREAVARAASWDDLRVGPSRSRLIGVILDEIGRLPREPLGLPMPRDERLRRIANALSTHPDDARSLEAWAAWAHIAPRTLTRRFVSETGFSFTAWRQRVRLLRALEKLAAGASVTAVTMDLGYSNVSTFIALFRRTFGVTPGAYRERLGTVSDGGARSTGETEGVTESDEFRPG